MSNFINLSSECINIESNSRIGSHIQITFANINADIGDDQQFHPGSHFQGQSANDISTQTL